MLSKLFFVTVSQTAKLKEVNRLATTVKEKLNKC